MRNAALSVSFSCALTYVQCCSACTAYLMSISQTPRLSLRSRFMKHESCSPCSNICLQLLFMSMAQDLIQAIVLLGQHPSRCLSTDTPHSSPLLSFTGAAMRAGGAGPPVQSSSGSCCGASGGLHRVAHPDMAVHLWQLPGALAGPRGVL